MVSFDLIGSKEKSVAIVEIGENDDQKEMAEQIMKNNKSVKSVLKKLSVRRGEFRLRGYELIAGDKNTEVVHKEHGYVLKLDPQRVYFSPREATERQRIAGGVKSGETVLVMFAGISALAIAIAKKQPKVKKIVSVEINLSAVEYAKENIRINKVSHLVSTIEGDVRGVCKNFPQTFDRILMPLPLEAANFVKDAINSSKKNGIISYYTIAENDDLSKDLEMIEKSAKQLNRNIKILDKQKVLPYSPHKFKYRIDFRVI